MNLISEKRFIEITSKFNSIGPILVLGDAGIDKYTYGEVNRISPEAPVPVLEVKKEWLKLGLAANVVDNFKTLGIGSTLLATIGPEKNGATFLELLSEQKLTTEGIVKLTDRQTIFKERVTTNTQQICRIDYENNEPLNQKDEERLLKKIESQASTHSALLIEDYGKGTLSESVIREAIKIFKSSKKLVTVDPSRTTNPHFYEGADLIKPNFVEAKLLAQSLGFKTDDVKEIARHLCTTLKIHSAIITLGGQGMAIYDSQKGNEVDIIPTVANEVFDVSGAGDTAISAITASLLTDATLEEAAWIGNCASGVVVGKKGTATVNLDELTDFYNRLAKGLKRKK